MTNLSSIVTVDISREGGTISRQGFGTMLFLDLHKVFTERTKSYNNTAEMLADGFTTQNAAYNAAVAYFAQNNHESPIKVARHLSADTAVVTIDTVSNSTEYKLVLDGTEYSFTSDSDATANEITAGLAAAINGGSDPFTATDNMDGTLDIDPDVASTDYTLVIDSGDLSLMSIAFTASETFSAVIPAIELVDDDWYALASYSQVQADIEALAATINPGKIYVAATSDAGVIADAYSAGEGSPDVANSLKDSAYSRVVCFYSANAATEYPDAALLGNRLGTDPGTATWKFKTLTGVSADALSTTQISNADSKSANHYTSVNSRNIFREGVTSSGEFIDVIRGIDWLQVRLQEDIYDLLVNSPKIPMTNGGIASVASRVQNRLDDAVTQGLISSYVITAPDINDIPLADRQARRLTGITFNATLAGAVHFVEIEGSVTV